MQLFMINRKRIYTNAIRLRNLMIFGKIDPTEYYINKKAKVVYIENPKVASTTLKKLIYYEKYNSDYSHSDFHLFINKFKELHLNHKIKNSFFCFSFVRNPFDRVISCYEDKIRGDRYLGTPFYGSYWNRLVFYMFSNRIVTNRDISFDLFVDSISKIPDSFADRHIRSQYSTLFHKRIPIYSYIGKLENFSHDILPILKKLKIKKFFTENKSNKRLDYSFYFKNDETARKIVRRYHNDFKTFNYSTNLKNYEDI